MRWVLIEQSLPASWKNEPADASWCTDIPSHVYQFTFESNPNWSRFYAKGGEIQEYLKDVAWKYDVEKYVRFRHYFQRAEWDESIQQWRIELTDLNTNKVSTSKI